MSTFPVYGQMDKESRAGAVAGNFTAKSVSADSMGAYVGLEAGSVFAFTMAAVTGAAFGGGMPVANTRVLVAAGSTAASPMRLTPGVAPTSPVDGDIWYDGTNLKMRVGGTTKTFTLA